MLSRKHVMSRACRWILSAWLAAAFQLAAQTLEIVQTNATIRVAAANVTSGNFQRYEEPGLRILKGLQPDIVAIQEFNVSNSFGINTPAAIRSMIDGTFGTNFVYFRESYTGIPNGVISRYPIVASGSWDDGDDNINDRGFAWAQIDVPGTNDLYVVSVHLKASSGTDNQLRRSAQATLLRSLIETNFPQDARLIVAGDLNLFSESEPAIITLRTFLSDTPAPADELGGTNTNQGRNRRFDRVLPGFSLTNALVPVAMPSRTFTNGLVFDSRVYTPLSDVAPVHFGDSGVSGMQHMAVVKDFQITYSITNYLTNPPSITTHPQSLGVEQGADAVFTVEAAGAEPLIYQWRFNLENLPGANASTYTRSNAQPADASAYSVVVSNSAGYAISSNATLGLNIPPPQLIIAAPGVLSWHGLSNLTYAVQSSTNLGSSNWTTIGTVTSPTAHLLFTNQSGDAAQQFYRVIVP
jgi:endonuclease/exonuclease/phosphatase family metal-dependent hydrolase